ncbi:UDP-N-acetylmuramate--L-alanine ligase [Flavihumibacter sp. ZG627]|uniref:UDP-N-acetylmuramate--L-alanine ligase n=1 Tax=Flavihumibacter sp. ZG627 TaxID=1463156 RepID=UPI00057DF666|nr:UDP-N-acetylmuramate--L-alanine ligase [Flavihumibacter sp. ZG627]KIC92534.1 UDP-N-acetylmuramate--alanine ligase [Flavihumibacter sp. ZG627]
MINLNDIKEVYFLGIGGIGMSALARYFHALGKKVSGYDKTATPLTAELENEGVNIHFQEDIAALPASPDLVIYTPAVPSEHIEYVHFQQMGTLMMKRSEVLGLISNNTFNICIAGTHGKTTTSSMTAHLLRHTGYGCNAFLGGITVNYNTNFWSHPRHVAVIEADEYDRSFLRLSPDIAVITSMDADHLDIYGTEESVQEAFIEFGRKLKPGGILFSKYGLSRSESLSATKHYTYSLNDPSADIYAKNIIMQEGGYRFSVVFPDGVIDEIILNMGGLHNVENAVVSIAIARNLEIEQVKIKDAIEAFRGVKRRFEYILKTKDMVFVDDYAHHPEELKVLISGAKSLFPDRKCTVIFQPHLYSRTRDLAEAFSASLDLADEVILLPIYPAREMPIEGVSSEIISRNISSEKVKLLNKEQLLNHLAGNYLHDDINRLIITAGAGDIDTLVKPIKELFN